MNSISLDGTQGRRKWHRRLCKIIGHRWETWTTTANVKRPGDTEWHREPVGNATVCGRCHASEGFYVQLPGEPRTYDSFLSWEGNTLPVGGTWSTMGDAADFTTR